VFNAVVFDFRYISTIVVILVRHARLSKSNYKLHSVDHCLSTENFNADDINRPAESDQIMYLKVRVTCKM